jgi:hypothetical protein
MSQPPQPQAPPMLTPASLFESQARADALRLETYNRLLSAVHQKIKHTSTLPASPQMTYFDIPEWQPGCPRFDVKDCILYIVWNLRHAGFKVMYVSPNRLLISWQEQSLQYYQEESPIRQAMMAAATATGGSGSRIGTSGRTATTEPRRKTTADYRPAPGGVAAMLARGASEGGGGRGGGGASRGGGSTITFI